MTVTINGTTGIAGVDGSAATPAVQGADTNTGMFFPAADTIAFTEGGTEVMRINSSGQVGIGTTSPTAPLDVKVGTGNFTVGLQGTANTQLTATGNLRFDTTAGTTVFTQNTTESMRLDSSGNLLVGCTSQANAARATYQTATNNARYIGFQTTAGAEIGFIFNNTTATQYSTTSDYRLKKDIVPMTGALAKVQALNPVTYKWKSNDSDAEGFIAHELAKVCPSAVVGTKDAVNKNGDPNYQGIDTSFLVATLTAAIQEQQAMIIALTARITALEATP